MRRNPRDAAALALLVIAGFAYYSRYYDCGFNTGDDGSLMLITMRLMAGERPYLDLALGYGLFWYYPLVLLFKITGVSFIVARIYLLSLAVVASLLAYLTVRRHTRVRVLALQVALLVLALPGMLDHVYMALAVIASMLAVSCIDLDRRSLDPRRAFAAALVAAVTWHIRTELGLAAAFVLAATLILHTISYPPERWPRHLARLSAAVAGGLLLPTLPLVLIAAGRGFLKSFIVYNTWPFHYLTQVPAIARTGSLVETQTDSAAQTGADAAAQAGTLLARVPLATVWEGGPLRPFAILTYLPLVFLALVVLVAFSRMLRRRLLGRPMVGNDTVGLLALAGLAFANFPQFFLFRPDLGHLSFFMPGYFVMAAACIGRWVLPAPDDAGDSGRGAPSKLDFRKLGRLALGALVLLHFGLYLWLGWSVPTAGSMIALSHARTERFLGPNGLDVAVTPLERYVFNKVTRIVDEYSEEGDTLLCFPFGPGWNVMTDRKTFLYSLYVDDTISADWQPKIVEKIRTERPPVILIDNWQINGTEISRFKNWATRVMRHIDSEYVLADSQGSLELYVLPAAEP